MDWNELWEGMKTGAVGMLTRVGIMLAASFIFSTAPVAVALIALGGGALATTFMNYRGWQKKDRKLINQFRDEVGATLGKDPQTVTKQDIELVAYGSPDMGLPGNRALQHGLQENQSRSLIKMLAAPLALAVVVGLGFMVHVDGAPLIDLLTDQFNTVKDNLFSGTGLAALAGVGGISMVAGAAMSVARIAFGVGLDKIFGGKQITSTEKIMELEGQLLKGKAVSPEQVLGAMVHSHPQLYQQLYEQAGDRLYDKLSNAQQRGLLNQQPYANYIYDLTTAINRGHIAPSELAFAAQGQHSGVAWVPYPHGPKVKAKPLDLGDVGEKIGEVLIGGDVKAAASLGVAAIPAATSAVKQIGHKAKPMQSLRTDFAARELARRDAPEMTPTQHAML